MTGERMRRIIDSALLAVVIILMVSASLAGDTATPHFKIISKFPLEGSGRWDYVYVDTDSRRLYMTQTTHVVVLNADTGAILGDIADTPGAHGIAIAPELGIGFISNGKENKVSVFDLKTFKVLSKIETGANPDSIFFHPATRTVFVQNGKSNSSTIIDAVKRTVIATIPLTGRPEFSVYDDHGNVFINLEDKSAITVIDAAGKKVKATWPIAGCEEPTGLAIDRSRHTLFSACANKVLAIVDSDSGKVVQTLPIGDDCDAVALDPETGNVFASNGEGMLTIIHRDASQKYAIEQNLPSMPGSKTMALDPSTHKIYIPSAKFTGSPTGHPRPSVVPGSIEVLVVGE
jgi:YVTN family beta-propeller protein